MDTIFPTPEGEPVEKKPRFADSYGLVLLLLFASFFVMAAAGNHLMGRAVTLVFLAVTTWMALRASQVERRLLRYAVALIPLVTIVALVLMFVGNEKLASSVGAGLAALLVIVSPVAIVRRLLRHPQISANTFYGAICIYLLIAMFFASIYGLQAAVSDTSFFAQMQPHGKPTSIDYLYFSFVTITTVGYGDLTAYFPVGKMTAVFEAILGQLYLITVVSLVVQNLAQARRENRKSHTDAE